MSLVNKYFLHLFDGPLAAPPLGGDPAPVLGAVPGLAQLARPRPPLRLVARQVRQVLLVQPQQSKYFSIKV